MLVEAVIQLFCVQGGPMQITLPAPIVTPNPDGMPKTRYSLQAYTEIHKTITATTTLKLFPDWGYRCCWAVASDCTWKSRYLGHEKEVLLADEDCAVH